MRLHALVLFGLVAVACTDTGDELENRSPMVASHSAAASAQELSAGLSTATLTIEGMVCESCAQAVHGRLEQVDGVHSVNMDFQRAMATVDFDPAKTTVEQLAKAVEHMERNPAPPLRVATRGVVPR
jgi:copper chaperone